VEVVVNFVFPDCWGLIMAMGGWLEVRLPLVMQHGEGKPEGKWPLLKLEALRQQEKAELEGERWWLAPEC